MDELPPKAAALLRAARREHDPSRADSERVRHALAAALVAPALSAGSEQALTLSKTASRWLSASWIKGVALVGLAAGATWVATWKAAETPTAGPAQRTTAAATPTATLAARAALVAPTPASASHAQPEAFAQVEAQAEKPARAAPPQPIAQAGVPPAPSTPRTRVRTETTKPGAATTTSTVTLPAAQPAAEPEAPGELALMRRALERLNTGDTQGALEQLSLHATRFPNGVMTEERDGLRAVAWCKGGDPARGVAAAHGFLRLYPDSPLVARVRAACKESAP